MMLLLFIHIVTQHEHHAMCPHQRKILTFIQLHLLRDISAWQMGRIYESHVKQADICLQQQLERPDKARWITTPALGLKTHWENVAWKDSVGVLLKGKLWTTLVQKWIRSINSDGYSNPYTL